jgi:hypothetical protein
MDTVWETGAPMVTSPKSTVAGLICRTAVLEPVDENGLESEPQPDNARPSDIVATLTTRALPAILLRNLLSGWVACGRLAVRSSLIPKIEILRNSHIDITCTKKDQSADAGNRP